MSARSRKKAQQAQALLAGPKKEPEVEAKDKTTVQLMKAPVLDWTELYINVYISEPSYEGSFGHMFGRARCYKAETVDQADLVVFCGGPDVNPALYREDPHPTTSGDDDRDIRDLALYRECLEKKIPMVGICRGAQFLHVMNGGKLIQDLDGHQGEHGMVVMHCAQVGTESYYDKVSSTHHQAVIEQPGMKVLGSVWSKSTYRHLSPTQSQSGRSQDIEAFFYPDTCCLGFQGHPEYAGYNRYTLWCLKMIERFIVNNKNVTIDEGKRYRHNRPVIIGLPPAINEEKK